jgi:hypothetical protein
MLLIRKYLLGVKAVLLIRLPKVRRVGANFDRFVTRRNNQSHVSEDSYLQGSTGACMKGNSDSLPFHDRSVANVTRI